MTRDDGARFGMLHRLKCAILRTPRTPRRRYIYQKKNQRSCTSKHNFHLPTLGQCFQVRRAWLLPCDIAVSWYANDCTGYPYCLRIGYRAADCSHDRARALSGQVEARQHASSIRDNYRSFPAPPRIFMIQTSQCSMSVHLVSSTVCLLSFMNSVGSFLIYIAERWL